MFVASREKRNQNMQSQRHVFTSGQGLTQTPKYVSPQRRSCEQLGSN